MSLNNIRISSIRNNNIVQSFKIAQQAVITPLVSPEYKNNTQTITGKQLKELIVKYIEDEKEYNESIVEKLNIDLASKPK